jgi:hypothetical protein
LTPPGTMPIRMGILRCRFSKKLGSKAPEGPKAAAAGFIVINLGGGTVDDEADRPVLADPAGGGEYRDGAWDEVGGGVDKDKGRDG